MMTVTRTKRGMRKKAATAESSYSIEGIPFQSTSVLSPIFAQKPDLVKINRGIR